MILEINSQDLPPCFDVGTYDNDAFSTNHACDLCEEITNDTELDHKAYFSAVVDAVADHIEKRLPGFRCLRDTKHSPKFYNYATDSVNWAIEIPDNVASSILYGEETEGKTVPGRLRFWLGYEVTESEGKAFSEYIAKVVKDAGIGDYDTQDDAPYIGAFIINK